MKISFPENRSLRSGFTLAELLLVIAIILVLSTLSLAVMQSAQEDARRAATESRSGLIESMMRSVLEDYEVRRLPISNAELASYVVANPIAGVPNRQQVRNLKRRIVADLIRAELAGWFFDTGSGSFQNSPDLGVFPTTLVPLDATPPPNPYNLGFRAWLDSEYANPVGGKLLSVRLEELATAEVRYWANFNGVTNFDLPGEYLYRILERIDVDGTSGVEALGAAAIGDPDGDGFPDVVDAWGESMQLRTLQVAVDFANSTPADDIWADVANTNWNAEDPVTLLPVGYEVINPVFPRSVQQFRFQIASPTIDAY